MISSRPCAKKPDCTFSAEPEMRCRRSVTPIVGAGIGGLALALTLLRQGFAVRVFKQATELGEAGAGVQLQTGAASCWRLFLAPRWRRLYARLPTRKCGFGIQVRRADSSTLARLPLAFWCSLLVRSSWRFASHPFERGAKTYAKNRHTLAMAVSGEGGPVTPIIRTGAACSVACVV